MEKPTLKQREPLMDYGEIITFVQDKYKIQVRDYKGLFGLAEGQESHFSEYCRVTGDKQPNDGYYPDYSGKGSNVEERRTVVRNGKRIYGTQEEYDADFKLIHEQYQRYKDWCKDNSPPEYLDYWHWLLDNSFPDVRNPCNQYWDLKGILDDEETPSWVKEITQKIYDEFKDNLDEDGGLEVLISW